MNTYDDNEVDPVKKAQREHDVNEKDESDMGDETIGGAGQADNQNDEGAA